MDHGKYIDFQRDTPNTFYTVFTEDESPDMRLITTQYTVAGDSDSVYYRIPTELVEMSGGIDDLVDLADFVAEKVNDSYPKFLKMAFNVPDDRCDSMVSNREVVSDRSLFVTKKRYAMNIVDDEGKKVSKVKIMGLEVKKSDTSKAVKKFLRKVIDMILDGCTRQDLIREKNEFKREFFTMGISEIGVPMPATMLKKYQDEFNFSQSMKGFPYHYRAAIFYNSLCGKMDRQIYVGEKFYVCNVKHIETNYIGIPVVLSKDPEHIMSQISIDYESMWAKTEKKIDNYMKSLGWDLKSRMKQQASDLFGVSG